MKSNDKKIYDNLGIKSVIMEEMYERTDEEKKNIREIKEILSSKSKFLSSVFGLRFVYRKIVGDSGYVNYLDGFASYEAAIDSELEHFYFAYKARGYDNFEIDSIEKEDGFLNDCTYRMEMHKIYDGYTLYATMVLNVREWKSK
nr:MAG TPA: hypothetical protein [Caudoviricetes sp.]